MNVAPPPDHGPGWEYLYFASELARGLAAHEAEYLEYQSQVTALTGLAVANPAGHIRQLTDEIRDATAEVPGLLSPAVLEPAFGPPGQPGDEAGIRSVAARLTEVYAELIFWGLRVRNANVEPTWRPVYAALAKYVSLPLHQFQDFSAALSAKTAKVIADVRAGVTQSEPLEVSLNVSVDPAAVSEFGAALVAMNSGTPSAPPSTQGSSTTAQPATDRNEMLAPYAPPAGSMPGDTPLERATQLPRYAWFRRFGDIPGVNYQTAAGIDPTKLPGHASAPEHHTSDFSDQHLEYLVWQHGSGTTSESPAHEWAFRSSADDSVDAVVSWCAEGLEIPGEPTDYHFLISHAVDQLHKLRRKDHRALAELERLCWLDIALIEAWPRAVLNEYSGDPSFYGVLAFNHLAGLYETEGALHEAMEVAERAGAFAPAWTGNKTAEQELAQARDKRTELAERIAAIDAETAG